MAMYTIGICDDCRNDIERLKTYIKGVDSCPTDILFYEYGDGEQLVRDIDRYHHLIFIDMQMPGMDGNETAKEIRKKNQDAVLVFCSGVVLPTTETFKAQPFRYLVKQAGKKAMQKEIKDILVQMVQKVQTPYLTVQYNGKIMRIRIDGIIYISIYRKQSKIHITKEEKERIRGEDGIVYMKKLEDVKVELENYGFACAHKSYLVNFAYIIKKEKYRIELAENIVLYCSRSRDKEFTKSFLEYLKLK